MPTREVPAAARPEVMLGAPRRGADAVLLDGGGSGSWGDGRVLYADGPVATLEVLACGRGRWTRGGRISWRQGAPLDQWQEFIDSAPALLPPAADLDACGVLTVLGYDLKHWIERLPRRHAWPRLPVLFAALYDWRYAGRHGDGTARLEAGSHGRLAERLRWYAAEATHGGAPRRPALRWSRPVPRLTKGAYVAMIERAREYIAAGDVYQVNLAQPFEAAAEAGAAPELFAAWRRAFPMPFAACVDAGDWALVSNSPECFLTVEGERVSTFPIKGTRRLAADGRASGRELRGDPKECAEHVMIVDLERNDLGRVCEPGSVEVASFARVETFPLLQHMVSEVRGRLRPGTSLSSLLRAVFPGGSITGAPKVRAMEIIEELEPCGRNLYTGSVGWTDLRGGSRFNLAIRSAVLEGGRIVYHAGGGIVADSDAEREHEETILKSETLFRSLAALQEGT